MTQTKRNFVIQRTRTSQKSTVKVNGHTSYNSFNFFGSIWVNSDLHKSEKPGPKLTES